MFGEDARIVATLEKDPCKTREEALLEIYRRLRPGEPPTVETAVAHLEGLFFDPHRYDVSKVGRYKFNKKMDIWSRLSGQEAAEPISADPLTGEILADARGRHFPCPGPRPLQQEASTRPSSRWATRMSRSSPTAWSIWRTSCPLTPPSTASRKRSASTPLQEMLEQLGPDERLGNCHCRPDDRPDPQPHHRGRHHGLHQLPQLRGLRALACLTTSTTWATAACAAWASCCRTSSASASPAWSG